jgi:hypothetical protein
MSRPKPSPESSETSSSLDSPGAHPTHEEIAIRAYEIYEASGRIEGRDGDHWLEAERELNEKYASERHHAKAKSA